MDTLQSDERKRRGITITEPSVGANDDEEDEPVVEQLVDKRKLKSIIIDTRAEDKKYRKEQREASLLNRHHPQPSPQPVNQPEHEGGFSGTQPDPLIQSSIAATSGDHTGNEGEDKDAEGNIIMKEAAATEENIDNQEKDKELEKQIEQETKLEKEDEGNEEFKRWINDETQFGPQPEKEVTIEEQPFDPEKFIQTPQNSTSIPPLETSTKDPTSPKAPTPPKDSPPKYSTPPISPLGSDDKSTSESSSSSHHSSPPPSVTTSKHKSIKKPDNPVDLQEQVQHLTTMVTNLAKQVEDFHGTKQQIDKFMKADLDGMIKTYTNDYLTENLVGIMTPQVTSLVEPLKDNLEYRIKSVVRKMLSTTPFTLQPAKASTTTPTASEPSFDELLVQIYEKIAYKTTITPEEIALV